MAATRRRYSDTGPFSVVPEWVIDLEVSDRAVRLYAVLGRYADDAKHEGWPSRSTLAKRLGCSVDSVDRAKDELVAAGALEVEHRTKDNGEPTSNLYRIIRSDPAAVVPPLGTDAATQPQGDGGGSRTGAAQNENQEREPMNDANVEDEWELSEAETERVAATIRATRARHGFVKRTEDA